MSGVWGTLVAGGAIGGLAGVIGTLITGAMNRPKTRADAVAVLTDSAVKQVNELQERTAEAEREAAATRAELAAARQQIRELVTEVDQMMAKMRLWRAAILSPTAELPALRQMVLSEAGGGANGRHVS